MRQKATVVRVSKFLCAKELAMGRVKYHNSNGTMAAVCEGVLYLACIHKKDRIAEHIPGVRVVNKHSVKDAAGGYTFAQDIRCTTWVGVSKEDFNSLGGWIKKDA
jgi:hypothetical protein